MAISNNTRSKYEQYNTPYAETEEQKRQREAAQQLAYSQPNNAPNNYAQQMQEMYNRVASKGAFSYDKANDKAYQQWAELYRQLGGLSTAATQQAAENLTAGYGSTYAPQVAAQTDNAYQANVDAALPAFYQQAQEEWYAQKQNDMAAYQAAIEGYKNIENSNVNRNNAWADIAGAAAGRSNQENANAINQYTDNRDFWLDQYWKEQNAANEAAETNSERYWNDNSLKENSRQFKAQLKEDTKQNKRDEYWSMNEVNVSIAADKADSYREKKDNKGMKAYLKAQVKKGNITQYQADAIYKQYKYTPPKSSGGSGGRRSSGSSSGKSGYSYIANDKSEYSKDTASIPKDLDSKAKQKQEKLKIPNGMLQQIGSNSTDYGRVNAIKSLKDKKVINDKQEAWLLDHYNLM